MSVTPSQFNQLICDEYTLPSGRKMSYCTFPEQNKEHYNVIYFHGFPGSAREALILQESANKLNCKIYAFDRPGFGHSDSVVVKSSKEYLETFIDDIMEFIEHQKWNNFSVIGVSGGGPYALKFVNTWMDTAKGDKLSKKLEAVAIVGGVYCPAGIDGMMPNNKMIYRLATSSSFFSTAALRIMFSVMRILSSISENIAIRAIVKDLPEVDRKVLTEEKWKRFFLDLMEDSTRQGSKAAEVEARVLFSEKYGFEEELKDKFATFDDFSLLPRITFYHGMLDVNVPISHSRAAQEQLFHNSKVVKCIEYPDEGHLSLIMCKADEYMHEILPLDLK